uniref:GH16 domain-containing protein n=1 Tax=Aegilops tauschii subsp. strangulata TaxID=200361 RepID=A0A453CTX9_AEGTS
MAVSSKQAHACVVLVVLCIAARTAAAWGRIDDRLEVNWGRGSHGTVSADGQVISLSLDRNSGSGFRSRDTYLYARIDLQIKLAPGNSAGTVTTCYVRYSCPYPF